MHRLLPDFCVSALNSMLWILEKNKITCCANKKASYKNENTPQKNKILKYTNNILMHVSQ